MAHEALSAHFDHSRLTRINLHCQRDRKRYILFEYKYIKLQGYIFMHLYACGIVFDAVSGSLTARQNNILLYKYYYQNSRIFYFN